MKLGINTLLWTAAFDESHLQLFDQVKNWGFDGIEIARFDFGGFPVEAIRRGLSDSGLDVTLCSAFTGSLSFISDDAALREKSFGFLKNAIETAAEIGAPILVGPYYASVGYLSGRRRTDDEWKRAVECLQRTAEVLDQHGIDLAIEPLNRFETYFLNTCADAAALCSQVGHPRVGVLFDSFHANIEEKHIEIALEALGAHLKHVHACENDRGAPGSGHVEWEGLLSGLTEADYDGWLTIESFGSRIPEIATAACIWRDLAPSAESLAQAGAFFLRTLMAD